MKNNIDRFRKLAGLTLKDLADKAGISRVYLSNLKDGKKPLNERVLVSIAEALGCDPADLISEPRDTGEPHLIHVVGFVGAGEEVIPFDDYAKGDGLYQVECPSMLDPAKTVAVEVRGDSMEPVISDGFRLFYDAKAYGVPEEFIGSICIVKLVEGATFVKKVRKGSKVGCYHLTSLNPTTPTIENAPVEWSAKVKVMVQL